MKGVSVIMNHSYYAQYKNVLLRPLEHDDIELLRVWRNDLSKTQYLRRLEYITKEMQEAWYRQYLENPNEVTFAIVETEKLSRVVGSITLYDFTDSTAEIGRIQIGDDDAHGMGIGRLALVMALLIGFRKLGMKVIRSEVHKENIAAHKNNMQIGFCIVGNHPAPMGGIEDDIEIDENRLTEVNSYISEIDLWGD